MADADPRAVLRRLYRRADDGFEIPKSEEKAIRDSRGSPVYGEITPTSIKRMFDYLELGPHDVFYDLGSGIGKVVNQLAITAPVARCVGVELSRTRCRIARSVLRKLRQEGRVLARRVVFRCESILDTNLADATVIYTCSTAFSWRFLARICRNIRALDRPLRFVTVQELEPTRGFELIDTLTLDMTWQRRDSVYVYQVGS